MSGTYSYASILALAKLDLGISHNQKDDLLKLSISAAAHELTRIGIVLDLDDEGDQLLLEMAAVHNYSHPKDQLEAYPKYLRRKINNRLLSQKMPVEY